MKGFKTIGTRRLGKVDVVETVQLPAGSKILRGGLDPRDQMQPSFWYTYSIHEEEAPPLPQQDHTLVVVRDGAQIPDSFNHIGMWWEGGITFHLLELIEEGPTEATGVPLQSEDLPLPGSYTDRPICRVSLGRVRNNPDFWELRVATKDSILARVMLSPRMFSSLMAGELVDARLAEAGEKDPPPGPARN